MVHLISYSRSSHFYPCSSRSQRQYPSPRRRTSWGLVLLLAIIFSISNFTWVEANPIGIGNDEPMTQWTLGEFEITLTPTPERLQFVDAILGDAIEQVVSHDMEVSFGSDFGFQYMYVASVQDIRASFDGGRTRRKTSSSRGRALQQQQQQQQQQGAVNSNSSSTVVIFNGGVVAFDGKPPVAAELAALMKSSVESNLLEVLLCNGGSWGLIEAVTFTTLELLAQPTPPPVTSETDVPITDMPTKAPTTSMSGEPVISGNKGKETESQSLEENNGASMAHVLGSLLGIAVFLLVAILIARISRRRSRRQTFGDSLEHAELRIDGVDPNKGRSGSGGGGGGGGDLEETSRNSKYYHSSFTTPPIATSNNQEGTSPERSFLTDETVEEEEEDACDQSEMAQYAPGELLGSISVGPGGSVASSEWVVDDGTATYAATSLEGESSCHSPVSSTGASPYDSCGVAAMAYASSETFERDTMVALQKDLLQSEWTHDPLPRQGESAMIMAPTFARPKPRTTATDLTVMDNTRRRKEKINSIKCDTPDEESEDQGEEIYLMPPSRLTPRGSFRGRNHAGDDDIDGSGKLL